MFVLLCDVVNVVVVVAPLLAKSSANTPAFSWRSTVIENPSAPGAAKAAAVITTATAALATVVTGLEPFLLGIWLPP